MRWLFLTSLLFFIYGIQSYNILNYAMKQYTIVFNLFVEYSVRTYPHYGDPSNNYWITTTPDSGWTSGFAPGILWKLYEYQPNAQNLQRAMNMTELTVLNINRTDAGNFGFIFLSGFGNGYRYTKNPDYLNTLLLGAKSLSNQYSPIVRCIRSIKSYMLFWVNIDSMVELELFLLASLESKNQTWHDIAWQHANRTMYEHFREDNSTYDCVVYDETDGSVYRKNQHEGYAEWSTWSRGQAWAVYGFTMFYRYDKYEPFLDKAIGAANYFLSRIYNESDLIPYWDFDAPHNNTGTYQPKDTSAAAIFASALVELSTFVNDTTLKDQYILTAKKILNQLSSSKYSIYGHSRYEIPALLTNGTTGSYPKAPHDIALIYGDYYFIEAVLRLQAIDVV